jgi:hypothetical protein
MPYVNMFPIYLEYESSDPFYTRAPLLGDPTTSEPADAQTLLFDPKLFQETFSLASLGQALKAQTEYAAFCFRATRPQNDGAARPLLGATPEEGYLGAILLEEAASKIQTLADFLSYDTVHGTLGPAPLDGYDPTQGVVFFPSRFRASHDRFEVIGQTPLPRRAIGFELLDDPLRSRLADQAWLLLGLARYVEATDPDGSLARQGVFGDERSGALFPFHYHGLAGALARTVAKNLLHLHWDKKHRTLVSTVLVKEEEQGRLVDVEDVSLAILAIGAYVDTMSDGDPLRTALLSVMEAQASYLLEIQQFDGAYPHAVEAGTVLVCKPVMWPLAAQSLAISAHLEVYRKLHDPVHKMAAMRTYEFMKEELWALDVQLFKTEEVTNGGVKYIVYTPYDYAVTLAALRDLVEATCDQAFADDHREYIEGLPHTRLLLSELQPTEDPVSPVDPEPDPDGDGIPFAPYACPPFGAAPVFAAKTILRVP